MRISVRCVSRAGSIALSQGGEVASTKHPGRMNANAMGTIGARTTVSAISFCNKFSGASRGETACPVSQEVEDGRTGKSHDIASMAELASVGSGRIAAQTYGANGGNLMA